MKISPKIALIKSSLKLRKGMNVSTENKKGNAENIRNGIVDITN